jgi:hypothetical protein
MTPPDAVNHLALIGAIFYVGMLALFGHRIRQLVRLGRDRSAQWTQRLRGISNASLGVASCTLFLVPLIWIVFPEDVYWPTVGLSIVILGIILVHVGAEVTGRLVAAHDAAEFVGTPLKSFLAHALCARLSELKRATVLLKSRLLPDGFRDVQPRKLAKLPFKGEYRALGALSLLVAVLAVMSALSLLGTGQGTLTQVIRTWSVFWVLMVAVSMTPPFALSWLALKYAAATGAIECELTLRALLSTVANWVSVGGVIGLLAGSLSFLPLRFMAESEVSQSPISLSILADLSLAGAVGGFVGAHFAVVFACTAAMKNRVAALILPVLTVSVFTFATSSAGSNPAANAEYSLALIRKSVVVPKYANDLELLANVDWKTVLVLSEESMRGAFPGPALFAGVMACATLFVALLILGRHVMASLQAAAAERRKPEGLRVV